MLGPRGNIGQDEVGTRQHPQRIEMMLADPSRMHAEFLGVKRFRGDVGDELVRRPGVVLVVVVAQREIAEFHDPLPLLLHLQVLRLHFQAVKR